MNICMVISTPLPPQEGIGFYVWNLSRYLIGQGHQVQIITRAQPHKPYREQVEGITIWRPFFLPVYPLHVQLHGIFVQRLVKRLEPKVDLFHLHSPLPPAIRTTKPIFLTVHSLMLPDARARKIEGPYDFFIKLQAPLSHLLERRLWHISRRISAVSVPVAEQIHQELPPDGEKVEVMYNGVEPLFLEEQGSVAPDRSELLYVGRLAPGKGLNDLVEAFRRVHTLYPAAHLSIAGDGSLSGSLLAAIEQDGLTNDITLLGHISARDTLRSMYQRAWALVLPSYHEGLPGVMLESMACGTPVVATAVGGIPAVIQDGVNGLLVEPRSPEMLSQAIIRLYEEEGLRGRLGQTARRTIEERFTWSVIGEHYAACCQELLAEGAR